MIDRNLSFPLPQPWEKQIFETQQIGPINYLVGPNGSGKSRFASEMVKHLEKSRLLGTDRLSGMGGFEFLQPFIGELFERGYAKDNFQHLRDAGKGGSGIDTILLLEERMDLRVQVEATLSHLFDRELTLDWDSGNLIARMRRQGGGSYRLDREECHGIKELLVLLTHLYDDKHQHLLIDEPELNLHPQYQAFFMEEVRKIAGDPTTDRTKKVVFLITHSPFVLDFRSEDDLNSVISFRLDCSAPPKQVANLNRVASSKSLALIRRLNAHHKQLFFSDNPVFVEGIHDAQLVEAMMAARGVSVAAAGSCIIAAGGNDAVTHYLELCKGLGKEAHFLYDLDSLFGGNLRSRIKSDESIRSFLAKAGHGNDLDDYVGKLESKLIDLAARILVTQSELDSIETLVKFLQSYGATRSNWDTTCLPKVRTAVMTAIGRHGEDLAATVLKEDVADIEGRLGQICETLKKKNIHLLPGGTIERYLPCYIGDEYKLTDNAKQRAIGNEIQKLSKPHTEAELSSRYGALYEVICSLPSKTDVDVDPVLRKYIARYIHELQATVVMNLDWQRDQIQAHLNREQLPIARLLSIQQFERGQQNEFSATIEIAEMLGQERKVVRVSDRTNAGMGDFQIEPCAVVDQSTP